MQSTIYSAEDEQELMARLWAPAIKDNPLAFVMFAFPWGVKGTPLENFQGPRKWQREVLLDVGSHWGGCALLALRHGHSVVAVEPAPESIRLWRANMAHNAATFPPGARAVLLPYAADEVAAQLPLRLDGRSTGNHMVVDGPGAKRLMDGKLASEPICVLPLDEAAAAAGEDVAALLRSTTLLKIDTMGHELRVARGMRALLEHLGGPEGKLTYGFMNIAPAKMRSKGGDDVELLRLFDEVGFALSMAGGQAITMKQWADNMKDDNLGGGLEFEAIRFSLLKGARTVVPPAVDA